MSFSTWVRLYNYQFTQLPQTDENHTSLRNRELKVQLREVSKVPYLQAQELGERDVPLQPLWDGSRWRQWVPDAEGRLVELADSEFLQGRYFAKKPASEESDGLFAFLELITKRASFADISPLAIGIENDLYNLGAVLWKVEHFFDLATGTSSSYLALTELEYALVVCRSLIDLLQEIVGRLWKRVQLGGRATSKQLPGSYRRMVLREGKPRTAEQVAEDWDIPSSLAEFYARSGAFFLALRSARDGIVHYGSTHSLIFRTESGFAVTSSAEPFTSLTVWPSEALKENGLGSLRYLLAMVVTKTLSICEEFAETFSSLITLPADIAPDYRVFVRGFFISPLRRLGQVSKNPWSRFTAPLTELNGIEEQS